MNKCACYRAAPCRHHSVWWCLVTFSSLLSSVHPTRTYTHFFIYDHIPLISKQVPWTEWKKYTHPPFLLWRLSVPVQRHLECFGITVPFVIPRWSLTGRAVLSITLQTMIHLHQQSQTDKIVPLPSFLPSQEPHKQSSRFIRPTALSRDDKILRRFKKHTLRPNKHEDTPPIPPPPPLLF